MKSFWSLFAAVFMVIAMVSPQPAEAKKRFGSGGFGKSYSTAPAQKKSTPDSTQQNQSAAQTGQTSKSGMGKGLMGGMLGGLLAGGLFAYLLGSGAFEGIQFMDILLLALVAFVLFKLLRGSRPQQQGHAYQGSAPHSQAQPQSPFPNGANTQQRTSSATSLGGMMDAARQAPPMNLPADFDHVGFIGGALDHYRKVQQAWNDGDLETIREYVSADLYEALAQQRSAMNDAPPQTEVLDLAADIVRADEVGSVRQISVLFRGRSRDLGDNSEDGIFDTWHLERDTSNSANPWLVVGIEAE